MLRQYNPYAATGTHNYTTDENEQKYLVSLGWKAEADGGWGGYSKLEPSTPTPATTFTVTFNSNGGTAVAKQTVQSGKTATKPANPTREGYTFVAWCTDSACTKSFDFSTKITKNITLYAKWDQKSYKVTFNSNGGSSVASQTVENGKTATKPADPTKAGATFGGWYTDSALTKSFNFATPITANITLYAKWNEDAVAKYCWISFDSNGGSFIRSMMTEYGKPATKPTDPTKSGLTFDGWYSDSKLTEPFDFSTPIVTDITLYAKWKGTQAFAVYSEDDESLNFYKRDSYPAEGDEYNGKIATKVYTRIEEYDILQFFTDSSLKKVNFVDKISPISTNRWFMGCSQLGSIENLENLDTSKVTDMVLMFSGCSSLASLDLSHFNTSNVKTMDGMFESCKSLETVNLSNWDTSSVEGMACMFSDCESLRNLDLSSFTTNNVEYMTEMFKDCSLLSVDCSGWNTTKVKYHDDFNTNAPGVIAPTWVN